MKISLFSNEYPPYIYGGAGVHVENISQALSQLSDVEVRCFGDQVINNPHLKVKGYPKGQLEQSPADPQHRIFDSIDRCIRFNQDKIDADLVNVHTWYTHFAGILAKVNHNIPLVVTVHSLEPLRPWKREQLGEGYNFSSWVEKTAIEMADAIIAVSNETKSSILRLFKVAADRIHVIPNGINPDVYKPIDSPQTLSKFGIDPDEPFVLFVGRITHQKGIIHLVNAIKYMNTDFQVVLCASAPDTKEIKEEMDTLFTKARKDHPQIVWIKEMVNNQDIIALYSHASVFCCPSVYEPFGIINIEAMACETPVVATATGGIKEVVDDGKTGFLVPTEIKDCAPVDPEQFAMEFASKVNALMADRPLREQFGKSGRKKVIEHYTWKKIAKATHSLYKRLRD